MTTSKQFTIEVLDPPTENVIGRLLVGGSVSLSEFEVTDVRTRGGGLKPEFHTLPETRDFFDIGYWDGKPFPIKGAMVVYLPKEILNEFSHEFVQSTVQSLVPLGSIPILRYYSDDGEEQ